MLHAVSPSKFNEMARIVVFHTSAVSGANAPFPVEGAHHGLLDAPDRVFGEAFAVGEDLKAGGLVRDVRSVSAS